MAKKNNDDDPNDEFGLGSSDDVNDADDNFGLPDVEYKPLDESEEDSEEESDSSSEESSEPEEPVYRESYSSGESYSSEESSNSGYEPPKSESIAPKLIIFAIILIVSAGAIWYFGFYSPAQKKAAEQARIEQQRKAQEEEAARKAEQERIAAERAVQDSIARAQAAIEEVPEVGEMTTISSRTGRYYVVVGSFVDDDLAKDLAGKLGGEGINTSLIPPWGEKKFYRLAVADLGSFDEAQAKADELKPTYGEGLWVLKY